MEILQVIDVVPTPEGWWVGLWRVRERTRWAIELHEDKTPVGGATPFRVGDLYAYECEGGEGELVQMDGSEIPADLKKLLPVPLQTAPKAGRPVVEWTVFGAPRGTLDHGADAGLAHPRDPGHRYAN